MEPFSGVIGIRQLSGRRCNDKKKIKERKKESKVMKVMLRKATKCMCMSNALAFLFPSLRGPPEV